MFVYLTGGIGTGKSTVLSMFADLGARIVSADVIVHALLADPGIQHRVGSALGVARPEDRREIADKVFGDEQALRALEAIVHPLVVSEIEALRRDISPEDVLVYEVPLLPTPGAGEPVIVVEAPLQSRLERLHDRGMSDQDARARIAAQPDESAYRAIASYVIRNDGDQDTLHERVESVWKELHSGASNI